MSAEIIDDLFDHVAKLELSLATKVCLARSRPAPTLRLSGHGIVVGRQGWL